MKAYHGLVIGLAMLLVAGAVALGGESLADLSGGCSGDQCVLVTGQCTSTGQGCQYYYDAVSYTHLTLPTKRIV